MHHTFINIFQKSNTYIVHIVGTICTASSTFYYGKQFGQIVTDGR